MTSGRKYGNGCAFLEHLQLPILSGVLGEAGRYLWRHPSDRGNFWPGTACSATSLTWLTSECPGGSISLGKAPGGSGAPWRLFKAIIKISEGQSVRHRHWWWVLRLGRWCRGEGQGSEPDVTFPENRHVRSLGLSGAPSLAHQPKWSHWALTSHLALVSGWGPQSSLRPRPGGRKGYNVQSFSLGETEAQTPVKEAEDDSGSVAWTDPARFQFKGL